MGLKKLLGRNKAEVEEEIGYGEMSENTKMILRRLGYVGKWVGFVLSIIAFIVGVGSFFHFAVWDDWLFFAFVGCIFAPIALGLVILGLIRLVKWITTGDSEINFFNWMVDVPRMDRY